MKSIGELIKALRQRDLMSQQQLAQRLHVTRQAVSNWENNKAQPDVELLTELARIFNITLDELVNGFCDINTQKSLSSDCHVKSLVELPTTEVSMNQTFNRSKKNPLLSAKEKLVLMTTPLIIAVIHCVLAVLGFNPFIGVMIAPVFSVIVMLIMTFSFENSIKTNDFSLIAGFKSDAYQDIESYVRQLRSLLLLVGAWTLLINILYFLLYTIDSANKMQVSTIILLVYIVGIGSFTAIVSFKYKK
ncbi:helix-turn-helix transcriptional regulator [Tuanshanicoccus lijuaniae]|uniref:helix-turn-helix transcriptional regulator n=1 Tax=Aerococcaceae bacterium zg-1292 TaxID=2774330 RepID=UPI001BD8BCB5|nr:helix-turn-helix domain-containing protein [Aerococcaceae bacterium zg-A91]MBS4457606.1 helix-turn-helix domain-containing protein [Aerococcaceae bacterium zg-BR33]